MTVGWVAIAAANSALAAEESHQEFAEPKELLEQARSASAAAEPSHLEAEQTKEAEDSASAAAGWLPLQARELGKQEAD